MKSKLLGVVCSEGERRGTHAMLCAWPPRVPGAPAGTVVATAQVGGWRLGEHTQTQSGFL